MRERLKVHAFKKTKKRAQTVVAIFSLDLLRCKELSVTSSSWSLEPTSVRTKIQASEASALLDTSRLLCVPRA